MVDELKKKARAAGCHAKACERCHGSGRSGLQTIALPGSANDTCSMCRGAGDLWSQDGTPGSWMSLSEVCAGLGIKT